MKVANRKDPFNISRETGVQLSPTERATLRKASLIARRIREMCKEQVGDLWEDDPYDIILTNVQNDALEVAEDGFIVFQEESNIR